MKKGPHKWKRFGAGALGILAAGCLLGACGSPAAAPPAAEAGGTAAPEETGAEGVRLNEVMASNNIYAAPDGGLYDWVELFNPAPEARDISGWALSDKANEARYVFPDGTVLQGGAYLTVYCSSDVAGDGVAPFGISAKDGESLYLFRPDGTRADKADIPPMAKGLSCQFDGRGWALTVTPTPGEANMANPVGDAPTSDALRLTELEASNDITLRDGDGEYSDWVEVSNTGDTPLDLEGWYLSDDPTDLLQWRFPALTLNAGERTVVFCSGKDRTGEELHANFGLFREGGGVYLTAPNGALADEMVYEAMEKNQVLRRTPEGGEELTYEATPGYPNTAEGLEAYLDGSDRPGDIVINEAAAWNNGSFKDIYGGAYDWVELQNLSDQAVSLGDYSLTNDDQIPDLFPLPDVTLEPGELYTLFCTEETPKNQDGNCVYAPFNIGTGGERLYLYAPGGELSDSVNVRDLTYGGSIGRMPGQKGFFLFETPTPGKENGDGARRKAGPVTADVASGIYNGVESLTVSLTGEGEIHYTTDGSVPTRQSPVYTEPFVLTKTSVFRAFSDAEGKAAGDAAAFSYIINENHTLPVVSLLSDPRTISAIFHGEYNAGGEGVVSLFTDEGMEFSRNCSIKIHGANSRVVYNKKCIMVEFNSRFGGDLEYDVFHNGWITEFSSLLLRGEELKANLIVRDSLTADVANRLSDTYLALQTRYSVLYINGEYYGLYPIREDYSKQYFASHTGATPESCIVARAPVNENSAPGTELHNIMNFVMRKNMADEENYAWVEERLDMTAWADWLLLEGFFDNRDSAGNIRYFYGDSTGGKWRPCFFDLDAALMTPEPSFYSVLQDTNQVNMFMSALTRSPKFQELLGQRAVLLLENGLADNLPLQIGNEFIEILEPEVARDAKRWNNDLYEWTRDKQVISAYLTDKRIAAFIDEVSQIIHLTPEEKQEMFGKYLDTLDTE